jgi:HK97 family phage major capsid protein
MTTKIHALRERRSALAKELRNSLDQNPGTAWNEVLQKKYDEGLDEVARIDAEIDRIQKVMDLDAERQFEDAVQQVNQRRGEMTPERAAFNQLLRDPNRLTAEQGVIIRNTMSTTTGSEGGFTVPSEIASELIAAMKDFSGVRQVADAFTTEGGNPLSYPGSDGTAEVGELIAENVTATALDPSFTTVALNVYKYSSKIVAVPFELLQDSTIDMEGFVRKRLAERIGRITNQHFTTGTGSGQPRGAATGATVGKTGTTGQTTTVIADDLIDLVHSVNSAYRNQGRCRFMMRDATFGSVRKLKDSQNRPIFIPGWDGLGKAMPDEILGYPVKVNDDVAAMAANARSILFGDFDYYKVRDALQVILFRFTDSAYAKLGQVGFLAWHRSGGNLVDPIAVKCYVNSAT